MTELKPISFRKGDIVRNVYASEKNPNRYLMYVGKGTIRQGRYVHKTYDCINYNGEKVDLFREGDPLEVVRHMDEFDAFMVSLKRLKNMEQEV